VARGPLPERPIVDLTPTLLQLQGCPIPDYMDGKVIAELMTDEFQAAHPPVIYPAKIEGRAATPGSWDAAAEAEVTERLKQLGYLG
jgi:hypothetical protein